VPGEPAARPLREAAQVMRIWISPWADAQDNLNWSSYVFTEITPKRWAFGEQEVRHQGMAPAFIPR
ncbi:TraV family lipoprotein, partial [Streptococcus cuniculi]